MLEKRKPRYFLALATTLLGIIAAVAVAMTVLAIFRGNLSESTPPTTTPKAMQLTKQQKAILDAIAFFLDKGELPTVREVGALVGLRSPATVLKHLRALEQAGLISINGKSRGIRLLQTGLEATARGKAPAASKTGAFRGLSATGEVPRQQVLPFPQQGLPAASNSGTAHIQRRIPLVGAIAAGKPFESYSEGFGWVPDGVSEDGLYQNTRGSSPAAIAPPGNTQEISIDPSMFVESGEVFALQIEGDSMVNAGILDGDYVIIRRQSSVEEGEIAAVIINGEGTLKRWRTRTAGKNGGTKTVSLVPANDKFAPIEIVEDDAKDVLVIGKYVGLVRGNLRFL